MQRRMAFVSLNWNQRAGLYILWRNFLEIHFSLSLHAVTITAEKSVGFHRLSSWNSFWLMSWLLGLGINGFLSLIFEGFAERLLLLKVTCTFASFNWCGSFKNSSFSRFLFPFLGSDVLHHCFRCVVKWKAEGSNALPWSCQSVREQEMALAWVLVPRASSLSILLRSWSLMCIHLCLSWVVRWSWCLQRAAARVQPSTK